MGERTYAVVGATGTVGKEVVRQLAAAGVRVRALVRSPQPASDPRLDYQRLELAAAIPQSAFAGADGAFLMTPLREAWTHWSRQFDTMLVNLLPSLPGR